MKSDERKKKFVALLEKLLRESDFIQNKLANKLGTSPSSLTRWLQGKIDPAGLEVLVFARLAQVANLPTESLVKELSILESDRISQDSSERFARFVQEMLIGQSQEQLGERLKVSQKTISNWINIEQKIDPGKMPINTIVRLARQRGWTVDRLIFYLGLELSEPLDEDLLATIESLTLQLSLPSFVKLQNWISREFQNKFEKLDLNIFSENKTQSSLSRNVCIILETEDLAIASNYASNLVLHLNLKPENIKVTTIPKLPESIADIDILIFDISTPESASIALIEDIEFDRDIIVFVDADLLTEARSSLEDKVTDLVVKPIDWQKLKDKAYFS